MMEVMAIMMVTFSVAFAIIMVVIHLFNSCSTNIVYNEGLFDEPSAVGKVQLSDDDDDSDSKSCISWNSDDSDMLSSYWGTESKPGIERVRPRRLFSQLRELEKIDREAFRVFFEVSEAVTNQSRS